MSDDNLTASTAGSPSGEYARSAVPNDVSSSALHLALIIIGGTIGFSVFIVAAQIGGSLGYSKAAAAFGLGSLLLGLMGAMTSYVGARTRLSTYLLAAFSFGRDGAKIVNLAVALSLIGWYGVISNFLGQAGQQMLLDAFGLAVPTYVTVLVASGLMIYITVLGFTGIDKLALYLVPVMLAFLLYAAFQSISGVESAPFTRTTDFTFQTAVSAVIGSYIAGVIIQPDYSRFAKSRIGAIWSVFIALGVVFPIVQFLSAVPSLSFGNSDLLAAMALLGLSIPAFFLLTLGAWSSNVLCLYSSGLSLATLLKRVTLKKIIIAIGVIGTAIAFVPAQAYLINFLVILGVVIPPIGAIYLVEAFVIRRFQFQTDALENEPRFNIAALAAWAMGSLFGFAAQNGVVTVTTVASLDSLIAATATHVFATRAWRQLSFNFD